VPAEEITYAAGACSARGKRVGLDELAAAAPLAAGASFTVPKLTYAGCGAAVLVAVDAETGQVTIQKIVVGADVGRAVNPALIEAQLAGGAAFGLGNAALESLEYDADGQLLTGTLLDYALPLTTDVPPIDTFYQEIPAHTNPLGLRGVGECGNPGLGAAIANAVCDALGDLGVRLTALPVTPARVWAAVEAAARQRR
jgi:aerobic carbon-monoxide dehydrogenase large subunit